MSDSTTKMATEPPQDSKSKKKRRNKKKPATTNTETAVQSVVEKNEDEQAADTAPVTEHEDNDANESEHEPEENDVAPPAGTSTETSVDEEVVADVRARAKSITKSKPVVDDATARFDALVKDRDVLAAEVRQLRQSLEELQAKHSGEIEEVKMELQETQGEKDHAEEQYQNLLGKVNTIRSQLGERLKADAEDLAQARTRIEELEEQKADLQERCTAGSSEIEELTSKTREQEHELNNLRSRSTLSQQNWLKEREELIESEAYIREEFENAKQAMHDWEVLAMEERQKCRDRTEYAADLEEQLATLKNEHERAVSERDMQSSTVDGLQKALQEIQEARRKELREIVETSQSETQALRKQLDEVRTNHERSKSDLELAQKELERALPFEKEVKEKNLLIGKLRHEAVILNEHLTKALRDIKKSKSDETVDRQIVTNHLLHFLALDRSDPKKFQILQLIAALLRWSDEQKEQAGLSRRGTAAGGSNNSDRGTSLTGSLRLPTSPLFGRTPSTSSLGAAAEYFHNSSNNNDAGSKTPDSAGLAERWQSFLEQEVSDTSQGGAKGKSARTDSVSRPMSPKSPN